MKEMHGTVTMSCGSLCVGLFRKKLFLCHFKNRIPWHEEEILTTFSTFDPKWENYRVTLTLELGGRRGSGKIQCWQPVWLRMFCMYVLLKRFQSNFFPLFRKVLNISQCQKHIIPSQFEWIFFNNIAFLPSCLKVWS